jgi:hypothetical protein
MEAWKSYWEHRRFVFAPEYVDYNPDAENQG